MFSGAGVTDVPIFTQKDLLDVKHFQENDAYLA